MCTVPLHAASWAWKWDETVAYDDKAVGLPNINLWRLTPRLRQAHEGGPDVGLQALVCNSLCSNVACLCRFCCIIRFATNGKAVVLSLLSLPLGKPDTTIEYSYEQHPAAAELLQSTVQCNDAAASLRKTNTCDLLELRVALREADNQPSIGRAGVCVLRALLLLLGESIVDIVPHQIQIPLLLARLLGTEMETASLKWSTQLLDAVEEVLHEGARLCSYNGVCRVALDCWLRHHT